VKRVARNEEGFAMVMVLGMTVLLLVLAFGLIDVMQSEASRSRTAVKRDAAYQAAEAGVDDYIAKLIDDRLYYVHFVPSGRGDAARNGKRPDRRVRADVAAVRRQRLDVSERERPLVRLGEARQRLRVQPRDHSADRE